MAGLGLAAPSAINPHPDAWLSAGPYEMGLSGVALLVADSLAERLDVAQPQRALLATAGAVALRNVSLAGGHPEDAVAVGLFLAGARTPAPHHLRLAQGGRVQRVVMPGQMLRVGFEARAR
jgi:hypothetical protein